MTRGVSWARGRKGDPSPRGRGAGRREREEGPDPLETRRHRRCDQGGFEGEEGGEVPSGRWE